MAGLSRWITPLVWALLVMLLAIGAWSLVRWMSIERINARIADRSIETMTPLPADPRARYAAAWYMERSQRYDEAAKILVGVRSVEDSGLAASAWFALGNAYFENGIRASRDDSVSGSIAENAAFDLARDAYRAALRIRPHLYDARYNLELLERLSPRRPGQGWRRNTDPIRIPPDRHSGWTTIKQLPKRGLP